MKGLELPNSPVILHHFKCTITLINKNNYEVNLELCVYWIKVGDVKVKLVEI